MGDMNIRKRVMKRIQQERAKSGAEEMFPKLVETRGTCPSSRINSPPFFTPRVTSGEDPPELLLDAFAGYRDTLPPSYQSLLDRYNSVMLPSRWWGSEVSGPHVGSLVYGGRR